MKARILEKSHKHLWDEFLKSHPLANIHQSSAWGHFQEKIPQRGKYWIIVLENSGKSTRILGGTMLIRHKLPKGFCWLYAARGPLLNYNSKNSQKQIDELLSAIKPIAKQEKAIFLRIDPPIQKNSKTEDKKHFAKLNFKNFHTVNYGFQPEHTLILDISKKEEEILAQMKPKGRYNIRLAEKRGVKAREADSVSAFYKILLETTKRDAFHSHNKDFYRNMLETLIPSKNAALYLAEYENKIIGGIIVTFFNNTATYYFGASSNEYRNVMAPYLLQWRAIKEAKNRGLKYYDFLGIAPLSAKNHPWQGVSEFKKKFGGQEISYVKPQEFAFKKPLYWLYRIYKWIKK